MGLVMKEEHIGKLRRIAERERAPFYVIGEATGDMQFTFVNHKTGEKPIDLKLEDMFGKAPRTVLNDRTIEETFEEPTYRADNLMGYLENVLQLEAVACKDWLTNKSRPVGDRPDRDAADRRQHQLPLNDCAVVALDYQGTHGIATALGHARRRRWLMRRRIGAGDHRSADQHRIRADRRRAVVGIAERELDVAVQESGRGRAALFGRPGGQRLRAGARNQHSDRQGLAVDDAEIPRRRTGIRARTVIITSAAGVSDVKKAVSPALKHRRTSWYTST